MPVPDSPAELRKALTELGLRPTCPVVVDRKKYGMRMLNLMPLLKDADLVCIGMLVSALQERPTEAFVEEKT